ncbi:MAG: GSCFA domain-containing protein [Muribaculaceae bacterium]|nr:GSCFA domain-containing protein [Muribaculaceae bacterium]
MLKFRTEYKISKGKWMLDPKQPVILLGSCFTDYIGTRMRSCRWRAYPNICGTLFNPASIAKILRIAASGDSFSDTISESVAHNDKLWVTWLSDSQCSAYDKTDTISAIHHKLSTLQQRLNDTATIIITFGTAWVYQLRNREEYIVANCHKFPADYFIRRRLTIQEIADQWRVLIEYIHQKFPKLRFIFTVSPVRHLKDGFEGNSRSKAILQLACEEICHDCQIADYFPAFEIVNDDLRDYRFYETDLVHPSSQAIEYIWEKFKDQYLSDESKSILDEGEKVTKRLQHRPIISHGKISSEYPESIERRKSLDLYHTFMSKYPDMLPIEE